jgi:GNAT superfamily N-acetyltransferase
LVIRELQRDDIAACTEILFSLGPWFGNPSSNANYIEALDREPAFVAIDDTQVRGFLALTRRDVGSAEIFVMAVDPSYHRRSIGRLLVGSAEQWCTERAISWLHVKTRGPSTYDDAYEATRQFYRALGFEVLYESMTEWGPQDAALVLVKHLSCTQ